MLRDIGAALLWAFLLGVLLFALGWALVFIAGGSEQDGGLGTIWSIGVVLVWGAFPVILVAAPIRLLVLTLRRRRAGA